VAETSFLVAIDGILASLDVVLGTALLLALLTNFLGRSGVESTRGGRHRRRGLSISFGWSLSRGRCRCG